MSEDVLERAEKQLRENPITLIASLAAEVRALRKDRERLRKELHQIVGIAFDLGREFPFGASTPHLCVLTDFVDAAMAREGEA